MLLEKWIISYGWRGHLSTAVAGSLITWALAPFEIWQLVLVSIAIFYLGLRDISPTKSFPRGFYYGLGFFGNGINWIYYSIHDFGRASVILSILIVITLIILLSLFFGIFAFVWTKLIRNTKYPLLDSLAFAACWTLQEIFRGWFLGGFPWLYIGYSQIDGPLSGLAPLGGVWFISFIIVITSTLIANGNHFFKKPSALQAASLVILVSIWAIGSFLKSYSWTNNVSSKKIQVSVVQGNIQQKLKWAPGQIDGQLDLYRSMTSTSMDSDLVIWPENSIPIREDQDEYYLRTIDRFIVSSRKTLILGIPTYKKVGNVEHTFNGITVIGDGRGTYLKQRLVPFGEYLPLKKYLQGIMDFFGLPISNFTAGLANQDYIRVKGYKVATPICYEIAYPNFVATLAKESAFLLTLSNDSWFGKSIGPFQHLQIARMRALETGRWLIRSTNNGITCIISPYGKITESLPQFVRDTMYGEITPVKYLTPYMKYRSYPLTILCVQILIIQIALSSRFLQSKWSF